MRPLVSFNGARATAIKDDSGGIKVLLTCMMDEQSAKDNGNVKWSTLWWFNASGVLLRRPGSESRSLAADEEKKQNLSKT